MAELLERADSLTTLQQLLQEARTRGRVALVAGEAGVGKSSLLRTAAAAHGTVWWGGCDALETPLPLAPWLDIAREQGPRFAGLLSGPRPTLFHAVLDELRAAPTPVLVVIEDAHWADDATLDLLKFLGRRIEGAHAVLAISFRDDEVTASHPLRRLIGELPSAAVRRLDLLRLSEAAVEALARQAQRPAEGLFAATRGNPFFVAEVLRHEGAAVPPTVQDLVLSRYARLRGPAQAILRVVALVPARIERALLDAVLSPAADDLQACVDAGLLQADGGFLHYRHELARVAIESSLSPPLAQALHAQMLAVLVASDGRVPAARLAHHAARAGDDEALARFAPAAADEAVSRGSHREAAQHWQAALRCTATAGDDAKRVPWLEACADACRHLGRLDEALGARRQLDAAYERAGDLRRQALNLSLSAQLHVLMTQNSAADAASRRAIGLLEALAPGRELATAYGMEGTLRMLNREPAASLDWCRRSIDLARRFGDRDRELASMATSACALMFVDYEAGCAESESVLRIASAEARHAVAATMRLNLGSGSGELMHTPVAVRWLREAIAYCAEHEMDGNVHYATAWLAICELRTGDWAAAADRASDVIDRALPGSISRLMALVALGTLRVRRGDPGAQPVLDEALSLAGRSDTLQRVAPVRAMRAEAAWLRGDLAACDAEARAALALARQREHPWFIGELAAWCWRAGTLHEAPAHCAEPFALEIAGRWREAADAWRRLGCPHARALALAEGDAEAQQEALAVFDALGAMPVAEALRRRLHGAGVRGVSRGARASTRSHPCGLTSAELRVLALMAEDLRDADIAARLQRSVRTVHHHVAAVLAKLEAGTRFEAVRRAEREGWLPARAPQSGQRGRAS